MRVGYKVFGKNMCSMDNDGYVRDQQFKTDEVYEIPDFAHIIFQGFTFYNSFEEIAKFHSLDPSMNLIYRVEILGDITEIRGIRFTNKIKLLREISKEEIEIHFKPRVDAIMVTSGSEEIQIRLAQAGLCLNKLVHSNRTNVRVEVARQGYGLDRLIKDASELVRYEVAAKGYGLDILAKDSSSLVRREVEYQGYDYEKAYQETELMFQAMVNAVHNKYCPVQSLVSMG